MGTLANVLEASGIATVMIALVREHAEQLMPPRALYCDFPLGRPLGRPNQPPFQRAVLDAAFALLSHPTGPVLVDFPESIKAEPSADLVACVLPPAYDPSVHPAVDEARGLRHAFDRQQASSAVSLVGNVLTADAIADVLGEFVLVAEGSPWRAVLRDDPTRLAQDIRGYYETAALALVEHVPAARASDAWFYGRTKAGAVLQAAQRVLRAQRYLGWRALVPFILQDADLQREP